MRRRQKLLAKIKSLIQSLRGSVSAGHKRLLSEVERTRDLNPPSILLADPEHHVFFGYYDINPFSADETKVLAMHVDAPLETPDGHAVATVGYYGLSEPDRTFSPVGSTATWCWQQGCRLRWYPWDGHQAIHYNALVDGGYGSIVQDIENGQVLHTLHHPIYDLDHTGNWGLSLNFSRLQRLRPGYGYVNLPDQSESDPCPADDGVWLVDISRDESALLFSLAQLAAIAPHDSMTDAQHYINHLSFSPSGDRFMFFHLWVDASGGRYSRLFTADREGSGLTLLNNTGHVSHYTWASDERLFVTTYVAPGQLRYVQYHPQTGFEGIVGLGQLTEDGHPTFAREEQMLVTDAYPDQFREQKLLLFDRKARTLRAMARHPLPKRFAGEVRCDLHPRLSKSERFLCVDVVAGDHRAVEIVDLTTILEIP